MKRLDAVDIAALATDLGVAFDVLDMRAVEAVVDQARQASPAHRDRSHPSDVAAVLLHGLVSRNVAPGRSRALGVLACRHALRLSGLDTEFDAAPTREVVSSIAAGELFELEVAYWLDDRVWAVLPAEGALGDVLSPDTAEALTRAAALSSPPKVLTIDVAHALAAVGTDATLLRILARIGIEPTTASASEPPAPRFSREVERAVERAWRRALAQRVDSIEPRHLLLGLSDADPELYARLMGRRGLHAAGADATEVDVEEFAAPYISDARDRDRVVIAARHALDMAALHIAPSGNRQFEDRARWWVGGVLAATSEAT